MNVRELRETIGEIQEICLAAGAGKTAADLAQLSQLFDGHEQESIDEFIEQLRAAYLPALQRASPATGPIDAELVSTYVEKLRASEADEGEFAKIFTDLLQDGRVSKAEANAIQHGFIGGREAWPTKKEALKAIEKRAFRNRFQSEVLEDIKKVTPW